MPGNTLGARSYYKYVADDGNIYSYLTDVDLGAAGGGLNDATFPNFPRRFKPRVVFVESMIGGKKVRKNLIVALPQSPVYMSSVTQLLAIDGTSFYTTGRRGEKASFPTPT